MMRPSVLLLVSVVALSGCSSTPLASAPGTQFEMALTVRGGDETFRCQLFQLPATPTFVTGGSHHYTPGSHHFLLFRTDLTTIAPGSEVARDCYEQGNDVMTHVRGVVVGGQVPDGQWGLPTGVALPLAAGEVVLLQAHYLNATTQDIAADVKVHLDTADGSTIHTSASVLFFYDPFIHVPAGTMATAGMQCGIPQDIHLVTAVSHFHKRGVGFGAYLDLPSAPLAASTFYTSTDWQHPGDLGPTLDIAAGSAIRWACDYDNRQGTRDYFQGPSAANNEMCVFSGLYYPAMAPDDDLCLGQAGRFGTGTATCGATLGCLQACPAGSAPVGLGRGGQPDVDPCWQTCFVSSCPSASVPLLNQFRCIASSCATQCATPSGSECTSCITSSCGSTISACLAATCDVP